MCIRRVAIALVPLAFAACTGSRLLSPRSTWGGDFADRSPPTEECPGGTLRQLGERMAVSSPQDPTDVEGSIPDAIRSRMTEQHRLYSFDFAMNPNADDYWGFSGYLVAQGDCIVHAEVTSYDN